MKTLFTTLLATGLCVAATSAKADIIFSDDFEGEGNTDNNTLASYDKHPPVPSGWVAANQGFGSGDAGLNLVDTNTVYSFRYTNSGLTSAQGVIGALTAGLTYTLSFDVSQDNGGASPYNVSLVTFNGAGRNDVRNNTGATSTLASDNGNAPVGGSTITLIYTADGTETTLGQDVAVRFFGASTSANIDNVSVSIVPEPGSLALLGLGGLLMASRRRRG